MPGYDGTNPEILDVEDFDDAIRVAASRAKRGDVGSVVAGQYLF